MTTTAGKLACALVASLLACAFPQARAQTSPAPTTPGPSGLGSITVTSTKMADLTADGVTIAVGLSITPTRTVTVESIRLSGLSVDTLPLHAEPIVQLLQLPKGKATTLPPLTVKVLFRDLTTVAPLRQMIDSKIVHVRGQANATLHASFVEKLALGTAHPVVSLPFTQDVPITLPDAPYATQAAGAILNLVQAMGSTSASLGSLVEPDWIKALRLQGPDALLHVQSRYSLEQSRTLYPIVVNLLAFKVAGSGVVTAPEAQMPWEYEPDFLARMQSGEARLAPQSVEVQVDRVTLTESESISPKPFLLTHGDFTLREQGTTTRTKTLVDGKSVTSVKARDRSGPGNLLAIVPQPASASSWPVGGLQPATASPAGTVAQTAWPKVVVFRLLAGTGEGPQVVELLQLAAHRDGALLRFDQPLDSAAFGSPVVAPEGVLAIVEDENTAAFLPPPASPPK